MEKRIINEMKKYNIFKYDYNITKNNNLFSLEFIYNGNKIMVILDNYYPFVCPKNIIINDIDIKHNIYNNVSHNVMKIVKNIYNINCFYCSSYMCANNWNPTIEIINIINEYFENKLLIKSIIVLLKYSSENKFICHDILINILKYIK